MNFSQYRQKQKDRFAIDELGKKLTNTKINNDVYVKKNPTREIGIQNNQQPQNIQRPHNDRPQNPATVKVQRNAMKSMRVSPDPMEIDDVRSKAKQVKIQRRPSTPNSSFNSPNNPTAIDLFDPSQPKIIIVNKTHSGRRIIGTDLRPMSVSPPPGFDFPKPILKSKPKTLTYVLLTYLNLTPNCESMLTVLEQDMIINIENDASLDDVTGALKRFCRNHAGLGYYDPNNSMNTIVEQWYMKIHRDLAEIKLDQNHDSFHNIKNVLLTCME